MSEKPVRNMVMPVAPMFASIMTGPAKHLVKKLCKVKNIKGHLQEEIAVVKEIHWNSVSSSMNLVETTIKIGTVGMVIGVAEPSTVLRFMASQPLNPDDMSIYHISVLNLEVIRE
jgi:hypothetical protein